MIDFIYILVVVGFALFALSLKIKDSSLGVISGMWIMVTGIYLAINGAGGVRNFLTDSIGIISIALGFYITLKGSIETIQEAI